MKTKTPLTLFWMRRDLRLDDNVGLFYALKENEHVLPLFIFDTSILSSLKPTDSRISFIFKIISELKIELQKMGSDLLVFFGEPREIFKKILSTENIKNLYFNEDYEPAARHRDSEILKLFKDLKSPVKSYKDHLIFAKDEILTDSRNPYLVFTPYKNKWLKQLQSSQLQEHKTEDFYSSLYKVNSPQKMLELQDLGFVKSAIEVPPPQWEGLQRYDQLRDIPFENGTSLVGPHLRFGTLSIRKMVQLARQKNTTWLSELIWREFFSQVLWHHPRVATESFRVEFERVEWRKDLKEFELWKQGLTGFPIVDAGMRELKNTGHMHNRVRMITANFLTKHLLMPWQWGEKYFAEHLLDFELASNNGNWQWCAGTGCDAAPYFRIFNPILQTRKFDPKMEYIQKWIPEYSTFGYPEPILDLDTARKRALIAFAKVKQQMGSNI
ncbi:MAG TPA: deoxyribodipyrimidine photo-lyase [Pseudobdellovibrionaceae bacterium]|nr:deoxyribodipyrimidine photo-lyase [Pseudobdellovibrionaceae bacterium]